MRLVTVVLCLWCLSLESTASDRWVFGKPIEVTPKPQAGVFQHLEGANRKHIASSGEVLAVVWEDNRTQDPQIYLSIKEPLNNQFSPAIQISTGVEAYEPAIASLPRQGFVITWEQDAEVFTRSFSRGQLSEPLQLSGSSAGHATVTTVDDQIYIAWREQVGREWFLKVSALSVNNDNKLKIQRTTSVEASGAKTPILFPALGVNSAGLCISWEDRRAGHTRLMFSYSKDHAKKFSPPQYLNEFYSNRNEYDKGNGVTRVSIAAFGEDEIVAAWMDKRRGENGYGIYGALGAEGGESFSPNERIHSQNGDKLPHYNPSTAGNISGDFVVVWDDFRQGDSDIWLSTYNDDSEWAEDFSPAVASGAGEQSHPSVSMDEAGNLHLIWMQRADVNAAGQLWYSFGKLTTE